MVDVYAGLLAQTRKALHLPEADSVRSHNVILTRRWMLSIPRGAQELDTVTANSAGMVRSVWLHSGAQLKRWKANGPATVLTYLGVSRPGTICVKDDMVNA